MKRVQTFIALLLAINICYSQVAYEGFGSQAIGGSNSPTVYHVTNLNSSGQGSLANGIGSNRTIVFDVSGTIIGRFDLAGISFLTIDGSGQNITINNNNAGDGVSFDGPSCHHNILKNIHVTNAGVDGINVVDGAHDILITNCTSWGNRDGNIDIAADDNGRTYNITVQWCIMGGGADNDKSYSGCNLVTGARVSIHHNLYLPATIGGVGERCPLVHCNYSPIGDPVNADIRNNVVYRFGRNDGTGSGFGANISYSATANIIANYYYSASDPDNAVITNGSYGSTPGGTAYVAGNVSGNIGVNPNDQNNHPIFDIPDPYKVATQDACSAASLVLSNAGCKPSSDVDKNFIAKVTLTNCSNGSNQPPTAFAGDDVKLVLPANSAALNGSGSDVDGTISKYLWTKTSGPATFTIVSPNTATTPVSNLVAGTYVFRLTVTDNKGASAFDETNVLVSEPSNSPPVASAGRDTIIILPSTTAQLAGSGSDADGIISSYLWSKVSGGTASINSPASPSTTVSGLSKGSYIFRLTVTDNKGASAFDDVTVNVIDTVTSQPGRLTIFTTDKRSGTSRSTHILKGLPAGSLIVIATTSETDRYNASITNNKNLKFVKRADASASQSGDAEVYTAVFTKGGDITITSDWGSWFQTSVAYVFTSQDSLMGSVRLATNQSIPNVSINTSEDNSILVCVSSDWYALNGSRTYRDPATDEQYYQTATKKGTAYHYIVITGKAGTYKEGLTSPTGMNAGTIVFEVRPK